MKKLIKLFISVAIVASLSGCVNTQKTQIALNEMHIQSSSNKDITKLININKLDIEEAQAKIDEAYRIKSEATGESINDMNVVELFVRSIQVYEVETLKNDKEQIDIIINDIEDYDPNIVNLVVVNFIDGEIPEYIKYNIEEEITISVKDGQLFLIGRFGE